MHYFTLQCKLTCCHQLCYSLSTLVGFNLVGSAEYIEHLLWEQHHYFEMCFLWCPGPHLLLPLDNGCDWFLWYFMSILVHRSVLCVDVDNLLTIVCRYWVKWLLLFFNSCARQQAQFKAILELKLMREMIARWLRFLASSALRPVEDKTWVCC